MPSLLEITLVLAYLGVSSAQGPDYCSKDSKNSCAKAVTGAGENPPKSVRRQECRSYLATTVTPDASYVPASHALGCRRALL